MKPARYIFLNQGLGMSAGKCAAQAAHAETLAMADFYKMPDPSTLSGPGKERVHTQNQLFQMWFGHGHYAKYVMKAKDSTQMYTIERYLKDRGFKTYTVVDEGHTEDTYMVPTAMAVELVDKDDERTDSIFSQFRMYKDKLPPGAISAANSQPAGRIGGESLKKPRGRWPWPWNLKKPPG